VFYYFNSEFTNKIKRIKNKTNEMTKIFAIFIGFVSDFIDFLCKFTVKIKEHTVASFESRDLKGKILTVNTCKYILKK
jgi:hypothetical protein